MSTTDGIRVDDEGTVFDITVMDDDEAADLSEATVKQIKFQKPSGTIVTKDAEFATDGTDGRLTYTTETGFLDTSGQWALQVYLELPTGKWHSTRPAFTVHANF